MNEHRKIEDGPWLWISKAAMDRARLAGGVNGVAIYVALCRLESDAPERFKDEFFASRNNISEYSGVPVRTITRYLAILQQSGLFRMSSGKSKEKGLPHQANRFKLLPFGNGGHSPMATNDEVCGQHKRISSHFVRRKEVRKNFGPEGEKQTGAAGDSLSAGADGIADAPEKKLPNVIGTF